jgi:threonine dehydratase
MPFHKRENGLELTGTNLRNTFIMFGPCICANWLTKTHAVRCITVSDESAVGACERFLDDHRVLVEPACGASLALAYDRVPELERYSRVLMIVCGGCGATAHQLRKWSAELRSAGAKKLAELRSAGAKKL